jgi:hypothetical protein
MSTNSFGSLCDDFGMTMHLASKVELPTQRDTVLHFFESVRKLYPKMTDFEKRDGNEYALEEERESGSYRFVNIDNRRLTSGFVNPPTLEDADVQNEKMLEMAPFHLGIHPLDTDALDVQCYFDLVYQGNHDEVVTVALASDGPFESFTKMSGSRVLNYQPNVMMALDDGCQLQARLSVETRTSAYQVRTGNFTDSPITVYFTIRQFWGRQPYKTYHESYLNQRRILDELVAEHVVPKIITPLRQVIGAKS